VNDGNGTSSLFAVRHADGSRDARGRFGDTLLLVSGIAVME